MNPTRRLLLRGALPGATLSLAFAGSLLRPTPVWAWTSPGSYLPQPSPVVFEMLQSLRSAQPIPSADIRIIVPSIAENGASVYIECASTLPEVDGLVVFVDRNPNPLIGAFWIGPQLVPELKTRIKLSQSSNVWVIARSRGQFYKASKQVIVTTGGCGIGLN